MEEIPAGECTYVYMVGEISFGLLVEFLLTYTTRYFSLYQRPGIVILFCFFYCRDVVSSAGCCINKSFAIKLVFISLIKKAWRVGI